MRKLFSHFRVTNLISNYSHSRILYWNEILYNAESVEKNKGMLDFKFAEKILLACLVVSKQVVFI